MKTDEEKLIQYAQEFESNCMARLDHPLIEKLNIDLIKEIQNEAYNQALSYLFDKSERMKGRYFKYTKETLINLQK